jgi:hypothetical protein
MLICGTPPPPVGSRNFARQGAFFKGVKYGPSYPIPVILDRPP